MYKNFNLFIIASLFAILAPIQALARVEPGLTAWSEAIYALPRNRSEQNPRGIQADPRIHSGFAAFCSSKAEQWEMLSNAIELFKKIQQEQKNNSKYWLPSNEGQHVPSCLSHNGSSSGFTPYAQKIIAKPGDEYIMRGDLHGDDISFVTQLIDMKKAGKIDDNFKLAAGVHIMTLGDYTDRGKYGAEVWYTLMRIANANPEQVTLIRGNHEDCAITSQYGFEDELKAKFGNDSQAKARYKKINDIHNLLPVVAYLGNEKGKFIQCCHGGLEQGYRPGPLLNATNTEQYQQLGLLNRKASVDEIVENSKTPDTVKTAMCNIQHHMHDNVKLATPCGATPSGKQEPSLGFMWNDFAPDSNGGTPIRNKPGRGIEYGKDGVNAVLDQQNTDQTKDKRITE